MQVSDDDIHHTNTSATPRRIVESSLETPDLLNSVPLAVIDQHSRLGPEVDGSDGVFQTACPGKYSVNFGQALRDDFSQYSSQPMDLTTSTDASSRTASSSEALLPERTACRLEEAPEPLVAVTHACPSHPSNRSGAAVENGDGGFRSPSAGKYPFVSGVSIVDAPSCSSGQRETHINNRNSDLRIYYQNVRGLRTKIDDFFLAVGDEEYDVIVLTETWLDDAIHSAQLFANSYTVIRTNRSPMNSRKTKGGGVLIAISSRLSCIRESAAISDSLEQLWIRIDMRSYIISIGVIYLPPDRKNDVHAIEQHVESIGSNFQSWYKRFRPIVWGLQSVSDSMDFA